MKRSEILVVAVLALVVGYLAFPHFRSLYAKIHTATGGRKRVITGTAEKGDDSGGVLTSAGGN